MPMTRKLLILVNPFGGAGKALTMFKQKVVPMLAEADIPYKMIVTGKEFISKDFQFLFAFWFVCES